MFVPMLVHAAHRFRFTLYDGLQLKHKRLVAMVCYGTAACHRGLVLLPAGEGTGTPARSDTAYSLDP